MSVIQQSETVSMLFRRFINVVLVVGGLPIAAFAQDLSLNLRAQGDAIHVALENHGRDVIRLRRVVLLDNVMGDLDVDIRREGVAYPLVSTINANLPVEDDYIWLRPGEVDEQKVAVVLMSSLFGLKRGCYEVSFTYLDRMASEFSAFGGEVASNTISLCVDGRRLGDAER